ncbi:MAG TPA: ATP-dependent sacrificial sulfur transferase LarE [Bacillota bacterium]|nr:ATP-dependent sacrificial sulfur transferase LarE [Bacillota bacterium]
MDLKTFFQINPKVALGFSGGVDSSYLLSAAIANGADVKAYFAQTPFQPQFELEDAKRMAAQLKANWQVLELDVLQDQQAAVNNEQRCYFCKQQIFGKLAEQAKADGYSVIIDGTNASDDVTDRPGMRALQEMQVLSPLRECGITKAEIRQLSKEAGLFTWNKPAYACLATRIPTGTPITRELLAKAERAEAVLFALGFTDFRVRQLGAYARIQVPSDQFLAVIEKREAIRQALSPDYCGILLDLQSR